MSMTGAVVAVPQPQPCAFGQHSFLSRLFSVSDSNDAIISSDSSFDAMLVHDAPCVPSMEDLQSRNVPFLRSTQEEHKRVPRETTLDPTTDAEYGTSKISPQYGKSDNNVGFALVERADIHFACHEWERSFAHWDEALLLQKKFYGERHLVVSRTLAKRGRAYCRMGLCYEAILDLESAFHIQQRESKNAASEDSDCEGKDPLLLLEMASTLLDLGKAQQRHGSHEEAIQSLRRCLSLTKQYYGSSTDANEHVARIECVIATYYQQGRNYRKALAGYRRGLKLYEEAGIPSSHPAVKWVHKCVSGRSMGANRLVWSRARSDNVI